MSGMYFSSIRTPCLWTHSMERGFFLKGFDGQLILEMSGFFSIGFAVWCLFIFDFRRGLVAGSVFSIFNDINTGMDYIWWKKRCLSFYIHATQNPSQDTCGDLFMVSGWFPMHFGYANSFGTVHRAEPILEIRGQQGQRPSAAGNSTHSGRLKVVTLSRGSKKQNDRLFFEATCKVGLVPFLQPDVVLHLLSVSWSVLQSIAASLWMTPLHVIYVIICLQTFLKHHMPRTRRWWCTRTQMKRWHSGGPVVG